MSLEVISFSLLALLVFFLGTTVWVGISLFIVGILSIILFTTNPPLTILSNMFWNNVNSPTMIALPLFILMGEILIRSGLSVRLLNGLEPWMIFMPVGLLHLHVGA